MHETGTDGHLKALDSIRGIAALSVVLGHSFYLYSDNTRRPVSMVLEPLAFFGSFAHPAVILFFVLSGFVLFLSYLKAREARYLSYLTRRIFRLYPAVIVAMIGVVALHWLVPPAQATADGAITGAWTLIGWGFTPTIEDVVRNISLIGLRMSDFELDGVSWSLAVEVRFSIIFVLAAMLCERSRLMLLGLAAISFVVGRHMVHDGAPLGGPATTLFYFPAFAFGIVAADIWTKRSGTQYWPSSPTFLTAAILGLLAIGRAVNDNLLWAGVFALVLFLICVGGPIRTALRIRPLLWLGKISYSLYLVHLPILMALTYALVRMTGLAVPLMIAPLVSLAVASTLYVLVEKPGMSMGKRVASALSRRPIDPLPQQPAL